MERKCNIAETLRTQSKTARTSHEQRLSTSKHVKKAHPCPFGNQQKFIFIGLVQSDATNGYRYVRKCENMPNMVKNRNCLPYVRLLLSQTVVPAALLSEVAFDSRLAVLQALTKSFVPLALH
jgi:hypothetical protein